VIGIAAIAIGDAKRRIVLDGGAEIGNRAVEVALVEPGVAAVVVGQRKRRIDADRFVVVGHRSVEIALEGVDPAPVGERTGRGWIEPDRLVEVGKRGVELSLLGQAVAAEAVGSRKPAAGFAFAIDDRAACGHLLVRGRRHADAGLPALVWGRPLGRRGRRLRKHRSGAQQCSDQAGQDTHFGHPRQVGSPFVAGLHRRVHVSK
jgi:hypothetical protein